MFEISNNFDEEFNTFPREGIYGIIFIYEVRSFPFISTLNFHSYRSSESCCAGVVVSKQPPAH